MDKLVKGGQGHTDEDVEESACSLVSYILFVLVAWFFWLAISV